MKPILRRAAGAAIPVITSLFFGLGAQAQSLSGIKIGDNIASSSSIGMKPVVQNQSGPYLMRRWKLADGNDLSITAERQTGKIVYAETNWGGGTGGRAADFPGFVYGKTTLEDIRNEMDGNGFAYKERMFAETRDGLVLFNSYEVEGSPGLVATFVTKISRKDADRFKRTKNFDLGKTARLDSIILADVNYLDAIWGDEKLKAESTTPIRWEQSRMAFEGIWAQTQAECKDEEGPNSRTVIDLRNMVNGKKTPLFDQYENHCKIADIIPGGIDIVLKVSCYEFWEKFEKDQDRQDGLIKLSARSAPLLEIEGKKYQLCKKL
jgi:hypothetical protein